MTQAIVNDHQAGEFDADDPSSTYHSGCSRAGVVHDVCETAHDSVGVESESTRLAHGKPVIQQSPHRMVGDQVFVTVPARITPIVSPLEKGDRAV